MSFNKWYEIQGWPELHRDKMRSAWNAAKRAERRKTVRSAVQHVKPKMPSYKEFDEYCHSINVDSVQAVYLFRYLARHFGR